MINSKTGKEKAVAEGEDYLTEYAYTPVKGDAGTWKIKAKGIYESGKEIETEEVPVTIYLDKIYTALPIIEKSKFIDMASKMAEDSWKKQGCRLHFRLLKLFSKRVGGRVYLWINMTDNFLIIYSE